MSNPNSANETTATEEAHHAKDISPEILDYLRAPEGLSQDVHNINIAVTALLLEAQAGYKWLNRPVPNVTAASAAFSRLLNHAHRVGLLVRDLEENSTTRK